MLNFNGGVPISFGYKSQLKKEANEKHIPCAYCGKEFSDEFTSTTEHVKPHSKGGLDNDTNYLTVCADDNFIRGNIPFDRFLKAFPEVSLHLDNNIQQFKNYQSEDPDLFKTESYIDKIEKSLEKESRGLLVIKDHHIKPSRALTELLYKKFEDKHAHYLDKKDLTPVHEFLEDLNSNESPLTHKKRHKKHTNKHENVTKNTPRLEIEGLPKRSHSCPIFVTLSDFLTKEEKENIFSRITLPDPVYQEPASPDTPKSSTSSDSIDRTWSGDSMDSSSSSDSENDFPWIVVTSKRRNRRIPSMLSDSSSDNLLFGSIPAVIPIDIPKGISSKQKTSLTIPNTVLFKKEKTVKPIETSETEKGSLHKSNNANQLRFALPLISRKLAPDQVMLKQL